MAQCTRHPYMESLSTLLVTTCVCSSEEKGVCGKVPDYAHEKLGFLTWHRLFLLWFEREIKIELDKPNFTLYYWDWRAGAAIDKLLTQDHFGGIGPNGSIEGNFGDWKPVCWEVKATKNNCNPDASNNVRTTLLRCPKIEQCSSSNSLWPSDEDVNVAVGKDTFDSGPYNALVASGLRNHVEGFKPVSKCPEEKKKPFCDEHCGERLLHNIVSHCTLEYTGAAQGGNYWGGGAKLACEPHPSPSLSSKHPKFSPAHLIHLPPLPPHVLPPLI